MNGRDNGSDSNCTSFDCLETLDNFDDAVSLSCVAFFPENVIWIFSLHSVWGLMLLVFFANSLYNNWLCVNSYDLMHQLLVLKLGVIESDRYAARANHRNRAHRFLAACQHGFFLDFDVQAMMLTVNDLRPRLANTAFDLYKDLMPLRAVTCKKRKEKEDDKKGKGKEEEKKGKGKDKDREKRIAEEKADIRSRLERLGNFKLAPS